MDDSSSPSAAENQPPSASKTPKQKRPTVSTQGKPAPGKALKQGQPPQTGSPSTKRATRPSAVASAPKAPPMTSTPPAEHEAAPVEEPTTLDEPITPAQPIAEMDEMSPDVVTIPEEPSLSEGMPTISPLSAEETVPSDEAATLDAAAPDAPASLTEQAPNSSAPPTETDAPPEKPAVSAEAPTSSPAPAESTMLPAAVSSAPAMSEPSALPAESDAPAPEAPFEPDEFPPPPRRVATVFRRIGASIGIVGALLVYGGAFLPNYGSGDYEKAALGNASYGLWIVVGLLLAPAFIIFVSNLFAWFTRPPLWLVVLCCLLVILVVWVHWLVEALFVGISCFDVCPPGGIRYGTGFWLPLIGFPASGLGIIIAAIASIRWRSKRPRPKPTT